MHYFQIIRSDELEQFIGLFRSYACAEFVRYACRGTQAITSG